VDVTVEAKPSTVILRSEATKDPVNSRAFSPSS